MLFKFKDICLYASIIVFLFVSVQYQLYSKDRQLFHIHQIKRGQLSFSKQLITNLQRLKQIQKNGIYITIKQSTRQLKLRVQGSDIFNVKNQNFVTLLKSLGQIKSHGDSFYKINDRHQIICNRQQILTITVQSNLLIIKGKFSDCQNSNYQIRLSKQDNTVELDVLSHGTLFNRVMVYFQHKKEQNYFGLGEQFSYLNLGHDRPYSLFVRQKGVGRTDQPETFVLNLMYGAGKSYYNSYSPTPIWFSSTLQSSQEGLQKPIHVGYILQSWAYTIWMNNNIYVWDTNFKIKIFVTTQIKKLLNKISQVNGYTPPVPSWINQGAIVGLQGGTDAVIKKYQILQKEGCKISGLWLQDWVSKRKTLGFSRLWWNWELDKNHYNNWNDMRSQLQKNNVSLLIYINPMLTSVVGQKQNYTTDYYQLAKEKQCFVKTKYGEIYQTSAFSNWKASIFDFKNNTIAQKYYKQILKNAIQQTGARGLMVDFGQAFPVQNMNNNIQQAAKLHNQYPTIYHKTVRQVLDQYKDVQIYTFSRASYLYTPKYTLSLWTGDQSMNFKKHSGLPCCLTAMLSSSLVGFSNTHCDIGGYSSYQLPLQKTSVRTQILMTRWMQLGAFSPVFRTHEGNLPDQSLQVYSNQKIAAQFSFYSNIFSALSAYRKSQAQLAEKQKIPLIRPFFVENENNIQAYKISDQFYLGSQILISPILSENNNRKVYIPKGIWVNIWNNKILQGCDCYIDHTQFLPSVFIKHNSIYKQSITNTISGILIKFSSKIEYLNIKKTGAEDL